MSEQLSLIAADGSELVFADLWVLVGYDNFGWPPHKFLISQGTYQDGATLERILLEPRVVTLRLTRVAASRDELWTERGNFWRYVLAIPTAPLRLRKTLPDGARRQLDCFLSKDPGNRQRGLGADQPHELELIAFDPLWYDPILGVAYFAVTGGNGNVQFPIEFPLTFGSSTISYTGPLNYPGTWKAEPVITAVGPLNDFIMQNLATDEKLDFATKAYDLASDETVVIDCRYGKKAVTSSVNGNIRKWLSNDSDLGTFHIGAPPEVPGGINTFHVEGTNADSDTLVKLEYVIRYIAV